MTSLRREGAEELEEELTGFVRLPRGQIFLGGIDMTGQGIGKWRHRGLSYVPSDRMGRGSSPQSPLVSNVIPYRVSGLAQKGILRRHSVHGFFRDLKTRFGLEGEPGQRLATLSGGNIQKLILARELEACPHVLVLAEPSWGLDQEARQELYRLVRQAARKGTAVLVLSSEPLELQELCTSIGVLYQGNLVALKPTDQWTNESLGKALLGVDE